MLRIKTYQPNTLYNIKKGDQYLAIGTTYNEGTKTFNVCYIEKETAGKKIAYFHDEVDLIAKEIPGAIIEANKEQITTIEMPIEAGHCLVDIEKWDKMAKGKRDIILADYPQEQIQQEEIDILLTNSADILTLQNDLTANSEEKLEEAEKEMEEKVQKEIEEKPEKEAEKKNCILKKLKNKLKNLFKIR